MFFNKKELKEKISFSKRIGVFIANIFNIFTEISINTEKAMDEKESNQIQYYRNKTLKLREQRKLHIEKIRSKKELSMHKTKGITFISTCMIIISVLLTLLGTDVFKNLMPLTMLLKFESVLTIILMLFILLTGYYCSSQLGLSHERFGIVYYLFLGYITASIIVSVYFNFQFLISVLEIENYIVKVIITLIKSILIDFGINILLYYKNCRNTLTFTNYELKDIDINLQNSNNQDNQEINNQESRNQEKVNFENQEEIKNQDEEIKNQDEEIKNQDEEIKNQDEEIKNQDEEIKNQENQDSLNQDLENQDLINQESRTNNQENLDSEKIKNLKSRKTENQDLNLDLNQDNKTTNNDLIKIETSENSSKTNDIDIDIKKKQDIETSNQDKILNQENQDKEIKNQENQDILKSKKSRIKKVESRNLENQDKEIKNQENQDLINQESRFTNQESRFTNQESRFTNQESRFTNQESRFTNQENQDLKKLSKEEKALLIYNKIESYKPNARIKISDFKNIVNGSSSDSEWKYIHKYLKDNNILYVKNRYSYKLDTNNNMRTLRGGKAI